MTISRVTDHQPVPAETNSHPLRKPDPILQELYAVRAKLNAEAGYNIERLMEIVQLEVKKFAAKPVN